MGRRFLPVFPAPRKNWAPLMPKCGRQRHSRFLSFPLSGFPREFGRVFHFGGSRIFGLVRQPPEKTIQGQKKDCKYFAPKSTSAIPLCGGNLHRTRRMFLAVFSASLQAKNCQDGSTRVVMKISLQFWPRPKWRYCLCSKKRFPGNSP